MTAATLTRPPAEKILEALPYLTDEERMELDRLLLVGTPVWVPQEGPQLMAADSEADIIFYGGQAGGGKTDLLIGLALTRHKRSQIFRREATQLVGIEERMAEILGTTDGYNGTDHIWRVDGRVVELGAVKDEKSKKKYQGRPADLKAFDEICHFSEAQFRFLIGWLRTKVPGQRCRVVCAGNPPTDAEGEWVLRFWAAWLDPMHPNPAKSGELRWFVMDAEGNDMEVPGPEPVLVKGRMRKPKSRTFIRSTLEDNLFYAASGEYRAVLDSLPEPLRSQMADGNFQAGRTDHVWQVIPTDWIKAAQARWVDREAQGLPKGPMTALGLDVARGGMDKTAAARRHGAWFDRVLSVPGAMTKDGPAAAGFVVPLVRNKAPLVVDSIGVGGSVLDHLQLLRLRVVAFVGSEASTGKDETGNLRFFNRRSEVAWRMREALDPTADEPIALPPDPELLGDLVALRFKIVKMGKEAGIQVRDKDEVREIIGRSPDKGDAVLNTFMDGLPTAVASDSVQRYRELRGLN